MSINELKEIVENAPEGATHYIDNTYFRKRANFPVGTWFEFTDKSAGFELTQASNLPEVARLEDIRTIIELYEGLQNAIEACYDLDSFGVRETNSDYINAYKLLERFE